MQYTASTPLRGLSFGALSSDLNYGQRFAAACEEVGVRCVGDLLTVAATDRPFLHRKLMAAVRLLPADFDSFLCEISTRFVFAESAPSQASSLTGATAASLELQLSLLKRASTGCSGLDRFLRGGFCAGHVTEVTGEAGVGKTQLCLQAIAAAASTGGKKQFAVYVVSEDIPMERLKQLCELYSAAINNEGLDDASARTVEEMLQRIVIRKVAGFEETEKVLLACEGMFEANAVSILVLDSIAAAVQQESSGSSSFSNWRSLRPSSHTAAGGRIGGESSQGERAMKLGAILRRFAAMANAPVVVANQVRSAMSLGSSGGGDIVPALGLPWASCVHTRLVMQRPPQRQSLRTMVVAFSPNLAPRQCSFEVSGIGVRRVAAAAPIATDITD